MKSQPLLVLELSSENSLSGTRDAQQELKDKLIAFKYKSHDKQNGLHSNETSDRK